MNNTKIYKLSGAILTGALFVPLASCAKQKVEVKPNVIVILADDLGYGDMSSYGATKISTPNLDKLANGGIRFTNGYSTSATSTPSRFALFTGVYPWRKSARVLPGDAPLLIDTDQPTLPKMMQAAGYKTGAIGKWHLGMGDGNLNWNEKISPCANDIGFDYSCLIAATNDRVPTVYVENGLVEGLDPADPIEVSYKKPFEGEPTARTNPELMKMEWSHGHNCSVINGIPRIGYMRGGERATWVDEDMADYFVAKVARFIDESKAEPFFLYYGLHQPHVPRAPHSRFVGATELGPRGDAIVEADWCVGELIAKLEREGLLENTLIIFSSDNGPILDDGYKDGAIEMLGEHNPTGGLRGNKYSLFDAGTRVPFIAYWQGKIKPEVSDALVCQVDLYPSLAKMVGGDIPAAIDGEETLEAFTDGSKEGRKSLILEAAGRLAYRTGDWVYIPAYEGAKYNSAHSEVGNSPVPMLYNLRDDRAQQENLFTVETGMAQSLKSEFEAKTEGYVNKIVTNTSPKKKNKN